MFVLVWLSIKASKKFNPLIVMSQNKFYDLEYIREKVDLLEAEQYSLPDKNSDVRKDFYSLLYRHTRNILQ